MLNKSKGPAVHSLRAQADKSDYSRRMRKVMENTENLFGTAKVKANGKKKIKVSWKKDKNASGYEITYSTKKSFKGKKTIVVKSNKTTSKVVKKLTSKKKYFVKVRSYKQVGKTKTYGAYSKVKTVKVK